MMGLDKFRKNEINLFRLEKCISEMENSLSKYCATQNVKPFYVKSRQDLIDRLSQVHKHYSSYKFLKIWLEVENYMDALHQMDSTVGSFQISLVFDPGTLPIQINYNLLEEL